MSETTTENVTDEPTALDKAQALIPGASVMPGTDGAALIVPTEAVVKVAEQVTTLNAKATEDRQSIYALNRQVNGQDDRIVDALKTAISEGTIDLDTAKTLAENNFDVDPDLLTPSYEVTVTLTVRVTGVKAADEDEAGSLITDGLTVDLSSYGITYDTLDVEDTTVDEVTDES